jgi:hypothetical protein
MIRIREAQNIWILRTRNIGNQNSNLFVNYLEIFRFTCVASQKFLHSNNEQIPGENLLTLPCICPAGSCRRT